MCDSIFNINDYCYYSSLHCFQYIFFHYYNNNKKKVICQRDVHNESIKNVQFSFRLKPIYFVHFILMNNTTDKANKIFDILLFERK